MKPITSFQGPYRFLSNFYLVDVVLDYDCYESVEHAFQAAKTTNMGIRYEIKIAPTPGAAKRFGRHVGLRDDWEKIKTDIMTDLVRQKFKHEELARKLLATGHAELIEGNDWDDRVWGCELVNGRWLGENRLGKILMKIRTELQRERSSAL